MENSTVNTELLVGQINDEMADLLLPATVYICILMVTGLIGNLMVCFYYGFKMKTSPTTIFIVTLAVYDLTVCALSMPTELVDIYKFYTFTNGPACKILRFVNYFAAIASILTLITIATDRYKHIRQAMRPQMTVAAARRYCVIVAAISLLLSWPSLLIYNSVKVPIPNEYGIDLTGADCTSTKAKTYKPYVWTFNIVHFIAFFICSTVLIVLYGIVGSTIYKHRKRMSRYKLNTRSSASDTQTSSITMSDDDKQLTKTSSNTTDLKKDSNINNHPTPEKKTESLELKTSAVKKISSEKSSSKGRTERSFDAETVRITLLMITVTAVFIVSFLPYLSLTIWRVYKGQHEAEFLSRAGLVAFKIGSRSFLLNSSLNPWIYGIFNSRFRQYYYNLICCKSRK